MDETVRFLIAQGKEIQQKVANLKILEESSIIASTSKLPVGLPDEGVSASERDVYIEKMTAMIVNNTQAADSEQ